MIHLVWSGYGFLVAVFTFGFSLLANIVTNYVTGSEAYWNAHKWPLAISLFVSATACLIVGLAFRHRNARVLVDPTDDSEVVVRKSHTLFFIPMIWWSPILAVFGLSALIAEFVN